MKNNTFPIQIHNLKKLNMFDIKYIFNLIESYRSLSKRIGGKFDDWQHIFLNSIIKLYTW